MRVLKSVVILLSIVLGGVFSVGAEGAVTSEVDQAFDKLMALNKMREGLAATLDGRKEPITEETFKQVCMPVGKALKEWATKAGYEASQVALKSRNPSNALTVADEPVFAKFAADPKRQRLEQVVESGGRSGVQLYARIPVVAACLHCHGGEAARPEFIKEKYRADKAFGFKVGDLRGLYSVFLPKK